MDDDLLGNQSFTDPTPASPDLDGAGNAASPPRNEDDLPSARETASVGPPDALVAYIRSIAHTPVLSRELDT